jgi:hypothetical protein
MAEFRGLRAEIPSTPQEDWGTAYGEPRKKAAGFFGPQMNAAGQPVTEYSLGEAGHTYPSMTPNQTPQQVQAILDASATGAPLPHDVLQNAANFRDQRAAQGQPPFWRIPEKQYAVPEQDLPTIRGLRRFR